MIMKDKKNQLKKIFIFINFIRIYFRNLDYMSYLLNDN